MANGETAQDKAQIKSLNLHRNFLFGGADFKSHGEDEDFAYTTCHSDQWGGLKEEGVQSGACGNLEAQPGVNCEASLCDIADQELCLGNPWHTRPLPQLPSHPCVPQGLGVGRAGFLPKYVLQRGRYVAAWNYH